MEVSAAEEWILFPPVSSLFENFFLPRRTGLLQLQHTIAGHINIDGARDRPPLEGSPSGKGPRTPEAILHDLRLYVERARLVSPGMINDGWAHMRRTAFRQAARVTAREGVGGGPREHPPHGFPSIVNRRLIRPHWFPHLLLVDLDTFPQMHCQLLHGGRMKQIVTT